MKSVLKMHETVTPKCNTALSVSGDNKGSADHSQMQIAEVKAQIKILVNFTSAVPPIPPISVCYASIYIFVLFCLFDLILCVPSTIFQLNRDGSAWVEPVLS